MSRRLTVAQLLPDLDAGGVERSTLEIADALVRAGHRAFVVSAGGRLVPQLQALGAEHVAMAIGRKSPWVLRHVQPLRRLFADHHVDIVHARSRLPAWLAHFALGSPDAASPHFVTTVHGLNSPSRYSRILATGERVICVSETVRAHVLRHYPDIDAARLQVIPRGIDPADFPRASAQAAGEARNRIAAQWPQLGGPGPLLLLPGRGTRLKGHADALQLLAGLRQSGSDARLWMVGARQSGRDAYIAELEGLARQLGVADAVALTPPTDAIAAAYAASDLVLQLSRKPEAFGRTVLEALAVGRPVLGWAHGGVGELLREWQPGGAVQAFDADALLHGAQGLLSAPPLPPVTMPDGLRAMQQATLALYEQLA
jgi:glycosyltransferase involved in cell wall biosynthesis